jgi:hypothetical protein
MNKKIIIACPRSGTTYISELFQLNNIDIKHECIGEDGISSWTLVGQDDESPWGPSFKYTMETFKDNQVEIYHQVRHPLDVISSMTTLKNVSFKYVQKHIPIENEDSQLLKCMKFWYYWNIKAETMTDKRYKLNDAKEYFGFNNDLDNKKVNSRDHKNYTFNDLYVEDKELTNKIEILMDKYGF